MNFFLTLFIQHCVNVLLFCINVIFGPKPIGIPFLSLLGSKLESLTLIYYLVKVNVNLFLGN